MTKTPGKRATTTPADAAEPRAAKARATMTSRVRSGAAKSAGTGQPREPGKAGAASAGTVTTVRPDAGLLSAREIKKLFGRLQAADPEPTTELVYDGPFQLLVAVILSAQATDVSVNKATAGLFARASSPQALLDLGEERLKQTIKTIGLYNAKAANILQTCRLLIERHGGRVPRDRAALEALPGVGRKTANVILNTAFGEPTIAVDTHIFRVANRTGLAPGATPLAVERRLLEVVPDAYRQHAHHWLILHGRYTCVARKPRCESCIISDLCRYPAKTADAPPSRR